MTWLWAYLAVGAAGLAGLLIWRKPWRPTPQSALIAQFRKPLTRSDWFLEHALAPALACGLTVVAWPAMLGMVAYEWLQGRRQARRKADALFRVRPQDLQRQTTVAEAEANERVTDPLRAVPELPFGHLYRVWQGFMDQRPEGAQLWAFNCRWTDQWGSERERTGYVWVRGATLAPWILTRDQRMDNLDD